MKKKTRHFPRRTCEEAINWSPKYIVPEPKRKEFEKTTWEEDLRRAKKEKPKKVLLELDVNYPITSVASMTLPLAVRLLHGVAAFKTIVVDGPHGHRATRAKGRTKWASGHLSGEIVKSLDDFPSTRGGSRKPLMLQTYEPELPFKSLTTEITYPFQGKNVRLTIFPLMYGKRKIREFPVGYILWMIAKEMQRMYLNEKRYAPFGHCISDLGFGGMDIYEDGTAEVSIES